MQYFRRFSFDAQANGHGDGGGITSTKNPFLAKPTSAWLFIRGFELKFYTKLEIELTDPISYSLSSSFSLCQLLLAHSLFVAFALRSSTHCRLTKNGCCCVHSLLWFILTRLHNLQ